MSKIYDILDRPSFLDKIFHYCTPLSIYRVKATCRDANVAVQDYVARTFDINDRLKHFFEDPISFRVLQARTSAIVSGSNALQLFDRSHYERSDLDVYVSGVDSTLEVCKWLRKNSYVYYPSQRQSKYTGPEATFSNCEDIEKFCRFTLDEGEVDSTVSHWDRVATTMDHPYRRTVLNFFRAKGQDEEGHASWRQVQVICGSNCPVEAILCYHSSA